MKRLLLLPCLLCCRLPAGAAGSPALAPASNWSMVLFTRENFHSMTLRGDRATFPSLQQVNVVDLNLTVFSSDATNRVETIILSTAASFLPKQNLAQGDHGVRVIRDDLEATGEQWTYDHAQKKVSLQGRVQIVFNAEIKNLLK